MTPYVNIHTHRPTGQLVELKAAGVHPWSAEEADPDHLPALGIGIQAIGEIGLDYARPVDRSRQEKLFRAQLVRAEELRLPVVLHCVRAFEPTMRILEGFTLPAVIFHGFIGSSQQAARATAQGYYLSFGRRSLASPKTREALRSTPPDRIFLETDDEDADIECIYAHAAEVLETSVENLMIATYENYKRIFH